MNPDQVVAEIMRLCPSRTDVKVMETPFGYQAEIVSNCKCGWSRSSLSVPPAALMSECHRGLSIAEYAAISLKTCRPPLVGMVCRHRCDSD